MRQARWGVGLVVVVLCLTGAALSEADDSTVKGEPIVIDGVEYANHGEYFLSDYFKSIGGRCGTPDPRDLPFTDPLEGIPADCTMYSTTINPDYEPGPIYEIPVVVHIITTTTGTGDISDQMVQSQIDILNEDYEALAGTPGANGTNAAIRFVLADTDPDGQPTNGIERVQNDTYFYCPRYCEPMKSALSWDTTRYLNIYTNNADGLLGWATFPQTDAGQPWDGVVILYQSLGRNSPFPPYDQGRTATHEVGHYLGLFHPFQSGCGSASACYTTADLICDTPPDESPTFSCVAGTSCSPPAPIPIENYMEYTNDTCMELFTPEQSNRMRCSLVNYRPTLYTIVNVADIFADDFETGDPYEWSNVVE